MAIDITSEMVALAVNRGSTGADAEVTRLYPVAVGLVSEYARGSTFPEDIENEAVIRVVGWLKSRGHGALEQSVDDLSIKWPSGMSPLRNSGAMALMSSFKQRRVI